MRAICAISAKDEAAAKPPISDARDSLPDVVSRGHHAGRITCVTRRGQRLAAIVPTEPAEAVERVEDAADVAEARATVAAARAALVRIDEGDTPVALTELRRALGG
ncbi:prevent-host-death protein [Micromonospora sp. WMMD987]|uniref:prevent-host-death protein n=1 Tax=Micromonospora sp. WMMD987 TaxID=3016089 RepID=UPI00249C6F42|nr:prevent-host-death protein [Micromonospora sp. WMMD987]WFE94670.1 prevent-host-death protein [Micromonospora sp. WMMD987]